MCSLKCEVLTIIHSKGRFVHVCTPTNCTRHSHLLGRLSAPDSSSAEADVRRMAQEAVNDVNVIDVHTHLFPASHGDLLLWGVDSLLTYHYLIAELYMVWNFLPSTVFPQLTLVLSFGTA